MFKTGVEQMITILDEIATESDIGKMYMDACGLSLEATTTDISGKSEALEKFLSSYESFANIVRAYEQILISDICNISEISNSWIERDREQSNQLKESNTLLDLLEHP